MDSTSQQPRLKQKPSITLYLAAASGLLGAIGMGLVLGWTAPAFESMAKADSEPRLTNSSEDKDAKTWIGSSMTLGALVGAMFSGTMAQYFGRKKALIIYGIPFTIGWILLSVAKSVPILIVGRVICGLSAGILSGTAPSYVVEIAVIEIRGLLGACFQLSVTVGILLVYIFGAFLPWKILAAISTVPTILMSIFMFFMPESPSWLVAKDRVSDAKQSLKKLRGEGSDYDQEMRILQQEAESKQGQGFQISMYKERPHFQPFLLAILLMFFQQFSGINAVMFYATNIFTEAGSSIEPKYATIIMGAAQVIATLIGSFLVDRLGRKILLVASAVLHVLSLSSLGLYYFVSQTKDVSNFGWVPLGSLVIFIIGFSIGFGPIPWLMVAEITPMESRSATSAIATTANWACAFLITKNFEFLQNTITKHGTFFLFSAICVASIIFVVMMLPETKGKSNEQIKQFFQPRNTNPLLNKGSNRNDKIELEKLDA